MRALAATVLVFCAVLLPPIGASTAPFLVVVDAGHGGRDPGAIGVSGVEEKTVTLAASERLVAALRTLEGVDVIATRHDDRFLSLVERLERVNALNADVMISLHADSLPALPELRGASVYTLATRASSGEAARKARRENQAASSAGPPPSNGESAVLPIVASLMRRFTTERSVDIAQWITAELATVTRVLPQPLLAADFVVLRSLNTPSVLVELGYLSNADDERLLADASHLERLARSIARGVERALNAPPVGATATVDAPADAERAVADRVVPRLSPGTWSGREVVPW